MISHPLYCRTVWSQGPSCFCAIFVVCLWQCMVQVPGIQNWPALPVTHSLHLVFSFPSYFPIKGSNLLGTWHCQLYTIPKFKPSDVRKKNCEEVVYVVQHKCIQSKKSFFIQPNDVGLHFAVKLGSLVWACHVGFQDWNGLVSFVCCLHPPSDVCVFM